MNIKPKNCINNKGFSLVELIVVIVILGVLVGIAAPSLVKYVGNARKTACNANRNVIKRGFLYKRSLAQDANFNDYITSGDYKNYMDKKDDKLCPSDGVFTLEANDTITCSVHGEMNEE